MTGLAQSVGPDLQKEEEWGAGCGFDPKCALMTAVLPQSECYWFNPQGQTNT